MSTNLTESFTDSQAASETETPQNSAPPVGATFFVGLRNVLLIEIAITTIVILIWRFF